jgi:hypothetical protein
MKLTRTATAGLVLAGVGLLIFLSFAVWLESIRTTVVDIPMPMRAEATSKDFTVDYDALYTVWVGFDRSVLPGAAKCLLGGRTLGFNAELECKNTAPLLKFAWELRRDGQSGGTGSSADLGSSLTADNKLNVDIVTFPAQKKHRYTLTLKFDQNASGLKMPAPRVLIELDLFNREDFFFAGAAFDSIALALCVIGGAMFCFPFLKAEFNHLKPPA